MLTPRQDNHAHRGGGAWHVQVSAKQTSQHPLPCAPNQHMHPSRNILPPGFGGGETSHTKRRGIQRTAYHRNKKDFLEQTDSAQSDA